MSQGQTRDKNKENQRFIPPLDHQTMNNEMQNPSQWDGTSTSETMSSFSTFDRETTTALLTRAYQKVKQLKMVALFLGGLLGIGLLGGVVGYILHYKSPHLKGVHNPTDEISDVLITKLKEMDKKLAGMAGRLEALELSSSRRTLDRTVTGIEMTKDQKDILSAISRQLNSLSVKATLGSIVPATCQEYLNYGISETGYYDIDPDGPLNGEPAIQVHCKFVNGTGITNVEHNGMTAQDISSCSSEGCHKIFLEYKQSTMKQMKTLIFLSESCRQEIEFDCYVAPLSKHGYWLDSNGSANYYFVGSNYNEEMCQCSLNNSCRFSPSKNKCNCDVVPSVTEWLTDKGYITNKTALPITGFQYGFLTNRGKARVSIGPLQCQDDRKFDLRTRPCLTLMKQGGKSGYHVIPQEDNSFVLKYCDMNQLDSFEQEEAMDPKYKLALQSDLPPPDSKILFSAMTNARINTGEIITFGNVQFAKEDSFHNPYFLAPNTGFYAFICSGNSYHASLWVTIQADVIRHPDKLDVNVYRTRKYITHGHFTCSFSVLMEAKESLYLKVTEGYLSFDAKKQMYFSFTGIRV